MQILIIDSDPPGRGEYLKHKAMKIIANCDFIVVPANDFQEMSSDDKGTYSAIIDASTVRIGRPTTIVIPLMDTNRLTEKIMLTSNQGIRHKGHERPYKYHR